MVKLLKEVYKTTGEFVPFTMRRKHPDDFRKIVQAKTKMMANHHVIILNHISTTPL